MSEKGQIMTELTARIGFDCPYCKKTTMQTGVFRRDGLNRKFYAKFVCKHCETVYKLQEE